MDMRMNGVLISKITHSQIGVLRGTSLSKLNFIFKEHAEFKAHVVNALTSR
jgi:hypothetical protein